VPTLDCFSFGRALNLVAHAVTDYCQTGDCPPCCSGWSSFSASRDRLSRKLPSRQRWATVRTHRRVPTETNL